MRSCGQLQVRGGAGVRQHTQDGPEELQDPSVQKANRSAGNCMEQSPIHVSHGSAQRQYWLDFSSSCEDFCELRP
jgi:hypothetical protein